MSAAKQGPPAVDDGVRSASAATWPGSAAPLATKPGGAPSSEPADDGVPARPGEVVLASETWRLGVLPGAVTAFGVINDTDGAVTIVFDEDLMDNEIINAHPLVNDATTSIARDDLLRFVRSTRHEPLILKLSS